MIDAGSPGGLPRWRQASTLLRAIASEESLLTAWDEVHADRGAPGVDGISVHGFVEELPERVEELGVQLMTGHYRPRPLRQVWVPKLGKEEEFRALAIPTVRDRIASRAAAQVLAHVFEPGFHDSSFGFRSGRDTLGAIRRITRLRDRGLRWVARADVDEFFPTIDQHQLFESLRTMLPWDVRRLLLLWTRTWVHDGADRFRLLRGLPQGTATSPLLANHFLTPFDEHIAFEGFEAVRYADDLTVCTATEAVARNAHAAIAAGLSPLGLRVNDRQTRIRSFDEGFEFLGFEFIGRSIRIAPSKIARFRQHARSVLEAPRAGSLRRRIALLNQMVRGWRAYYRAGVPREQFEELDGWLEQEVRAATLRRWATARPAPRDLELAGLESFARSGRRIFQPPRPPTLQGYDYRIPLEGGEADRAVVLVGATETLESEPRPHVVDAGRNRRALPAALRTIVIADGARCEARALRVLLDSGISLRFVPALPATAGAPLPARPV